jgi:hypothetical protein
MVDAIGGFLAKQVFESKVDSITKDVSESLGLSFGEEEKTQSVRQGPTWEERKAEEARMAAERKRREEEREKRREKSREKANAIRSKYGIPTQEREGTPDETLLGASHKTTSSNVAYHKSQATSCCTLF